MEKMYLQLTYRTKVVIEVSVANRSSAFDRIYRQGYRKNYDDFCGVIAKNGNIEKIKIVEDKGEVTCQAIRKPDSWEL